MISVIIPAHDCESTIDACLRSILSQATQGGVEVIIIDDGSVDGTYEKAQAFAAHDGVRIMRTPTRQGASHARNRGIEAAKGEWLMFVDADDTLAEGALPTLEAQARRTGAGMVVGAHLKRFAHAPAVENHHGTDAAAIVGGQLLPTRELGAYVARYAREPYLYTMLVHCWGKLFRREVAAAHGIAFDEALDQLEDVDFNFRFLAHCGTVCYVDQLCYHHHIGHAETMSAKSGTEADAVGKAGKVYEAVQRFLVQVCAMPEAAARKLVGHLLVTTCVIWIMRIARRVRRAGFREIARGIEPILTSSLLRTRLPDYTLMPRDSRVVYLGVVSGSPTFCALALCLST